MPWSPDRSHPQPWQQVGGGLPGGVDLPVDASHRWSLWDHPGKVERPPKEEGERVPVFAVGIPVVPCGGVCDRNGAQLLAESGTLGLLRLGTQLVRSSVPPLWTLLGCHLSGCILGE